jgi:dinuclear metal center YbgI/SA1388 family protein
MPADLSELASYLDGYLRVAEIADSDRALNGLQLENSGTVSRIAVAVDVCQVTIDRAADLGADLLIVHHGLFWGGLGPLTGRHGRRVRSMHERGIALYSVHLPLDLHPVVGNNAVLARQLGVDKTVWFGDYMGHPLGLAGNLDSTFVELSVSVGELLGVTPHVIAAGPERVSRVGVVTGHGGSHMKQVVEAGLDTFVTGEGAHHTHFDAEEWGLNVVYAGHYATETGGVQALAGHLEAIFGVPWDFIDHPTGL